MIILQYKGTRKLQKGDIYLSNLGSYLNWNQNCTSDLEYPVYEKREILTPNTAVSFRLSFYKEKYEESLLYHTNIFDIPSRKVKKYIWKHDIWKTTKHMSEKELIDAGICLASVTKIPESEVEE